jgi:hypothetical protein
MAHAETTAIIRAPVEAVWHALNDIDNTKDWVVGLEKAVIITTGEFGVGSAYYDYNRLGPFLQKTLWRITEFEPTTQQAHVSESKVLPSTIRFALSPVPEGTYVRMVVDFQFLPQLGIIGRLLERAVLSQGIENIISKNLANLDVYLARKVLQPA